MAYRNPENADFELGPWDAGVQNQIPTGSIPTTALADALNVDLTREGKIQRRGGYLKITNSIFSGERCSSLFAWNGFAFFVRSGDFVACNPTSGQEQTILAGVGPISIGCCALGKDLYFSSSAGFSGRVQSTPGGAQPFLVRPFGVDRPYNFPMGFAGAAGSGGLEAGVYQYCWTWQMFDGEEGGSTVPAQVTVPANGSIEFEGFGVPPSAQITGLNLYMSTPNGTELFLRKTYNLQIPSWPILYDTVTAINWQGSAIQTLLLNPMPFVDGLDLFRGRFFGFAGSVVWHSNGMRYGLFDNSQNFLQYEREISLIAAFPSGFYVCTKPGPDGDNGAAYWLDGESPATINQRKVLPMGAVSGSLTRLENSNDVAWWSPFGLVIAKDGGDVSLPFDGKTAVESYGSIAGLHRRENGLDQIIFTGAAKGGIQSAGFSDSFAAQVISSS